MLSRLPFDCPAGRAMTGYRAPSAPTRYLSTDIYIKQPSKQRYERQGVDADVAGDVDKTDYDS